MCPETTRIPRGKPPAIPNRPAALPRTFFLRFGKLVDPIAFEKLRADACLPSDIDIGDATAPSFLDVRRSDKKIKHYIDELEKGIGELSPDLRRRIENEGLAVHKLKRQEKPCLALFLDEILDGYYASSPMHPIASEDVKRYTNPYEGVSAVDRWCRYSFFLRQELSNLPEHGLTDKTLNLAVDVDRLLQEFEQNLTGASKVIEANASWKRVQIEIPQELRETLTVPIVLSPKSASIDLAVHSSIDVGEIYRTGETSLGNLQSIRNILNASLVGFHAEPNADTLERLEILLARIDQVIDRPEMTQSCRKSVGSLVATLHRIGLYADALTDVENDVDTPANIILLLMDLSAVVGSEQERYQKIRLRDGNEGIRLLRDALILHLSCFYTMLTGHMPSSTGSDYNKQSSDLPGAFPALARSLLRMVGDDASEATLRRSIMTTNRILKQLSISEEVVPPESWGKVYLQMVRDGLKNI